MFSKISAAGSAAALLAAASAAHAITVDGTLDAGYGAPTAIVLSDPTGSAPTTSYDFQHPGTTTSGESYNVYLSSDATSVYGYIQGTGVGTSAGNFTNLYFDLNPPVNDGTDIGFEVTNKRAFVAGGPANEYASIGIVFANGPNNSIEFSIPNSAFTAPIAGLTYYPGQTFASTGSTVILGLSQTLGYSVEGRNLGSVTIGGSTGAVSAAPEPATWALMFLGVGAVGYGLRRRKSSDAALRLA